MEEIDRISNLPLELNAEIFSRLPLNKLLSLKRVSKRWHEEINSQAFAQLHLRHQSLNPTSTGGSLLLIGRGSSFFSFNFSLSVVDRCILKKLTYLPPPHFETSPHELVGSCNGLLCFQEKYLGFLRVFNPVTGAHRLVPPPPRYPTKVGFGYDAMSDDYKVLSLVPFEKAHIYSLKKGSWRPIFKTGPLGYVANPMKLCMAFTNNALHWINAPKLEDNNSFIISCVDLKTEKYDEVAPPERMFDSADVDLVGLRGFLHLINLPTHSHLSIWVMKGENRSGSKQYSWVKLFHCSLADLFWDLYGELTCSWFWPLGLWPLPYAYTEDDQVLLLGLEQHPRNFFRVDLQSGKARRVELLGLPDNEFDQFVVLPWVPSLVSPCQLS